MSDVAKTLSVEEQANYEKLSNVIDLYSGKEGCLIQVLHAAQEIFGYLPYEVQKYVADNMGFSVSYVSSVSSFYSFFSMVPKGKYVIGVCLGTACYVKGSQLVCDKFGELLGIKPGETTPDGLFTLDLLRCIGACAVAPAVSINGKVYPQVKVDNVKNIIEEYRAKEAN